MTATASLYAQKIRRRFLPALSLAAFACSLPLRAETMPAIAHPETWPAASSPVAIDSAIEQRIDTLLAAMSLEQKVGQVIQSDIGSITPAEVRKYHLGSILNGGNSDPGGKYNAHARDWLAAADAFYAASMEPDGKLPRIPVIWGSDAVHGHNNVVGATLFPHNIGLGAARNPDLLRRIGEATAIEMRVTGLDWTFAPTLAVVRDDRWGRTYEGFGEHPEIAASYAGPLVEGLQGKVGDRDWLRGPHIIATAKHFLGDGGTKSGKDQGDTEIGEAGLRTLFGAPYGPALAAGVQSVMASFSGWNGAKMHGNESLLTGVLKQRWGFDGLVVGDWNGHAQVAGCTATDCPQSMIAGLDLYMAPDSWKALYETTFKHAKDGSLPMARLDDAVRRILRVKLRARLLEAGKPSSRPFAGKYELLASPEHRALAREAVRESLVLLKNQGSLLPLKPGAKLLVAGDGADNVGKQAGGWTLTWQGTDTKPSDFPNAQSIWQGIEETVKAAGGTAQLSADGRYTQKPDVAIVVFGEDPYAEFQGDRPDVAFEDKVGSLALLKSLKAAGLPTVSVFLSGRAMWVNPLLNASDAFVAAWLPGSEGGGVADVLFGKTDFKGRLPYSWPKRSDQTAANVGDADYDPLFPYGFGLTFGDKGDLASLPEDRAGGPVTDSGTLFAAGKPGAGRKLLLGAPGALSTNPEPDLVTARTADRNAQEDSVHLAWTGKGMGIAAIAQEEAADLTRESNGDLVLELDQKGQRRALGQCQPRHGLRQQVRGRLPDPRVARRGCEDRQMDPYRGRSSAAADESFVSVQSQHLVAMLSVAGLVVDDDRCEHGPVADQDPLFAIEIEARGNGSLTAVIDARERKIVRPEHTAIELTGAPPQSLICASAQSEKAVAQQELEGAIPFLPNGEDLMAAVSGIDAFPESDERTARATGVCRRRE